MGCLTPSALAIFIPPNPLRSQENLAAMEHLIVDGHEIDRHQYCSRSVSYCFIHVRGYTRFEGPLCMAAVLGDVL